MGADVRASLFSFLRLWVAKRFLPRGYAIWTWGHHDGLDAEVFTKELRDA